MLSPAPTEAATEARPTGASGPLGIDAGTWALAAITGLAAVLRFATLSSQSYWLDEAQAVHELHLSFGAMLTAWSRYEWNPPLYLLVAWPWAKLFGTGELALRSLSALLGVALIPLVYLCCRELVSRPAGLMAAAFAAVNPFMIWYSQEAREYMLLVVLCAGSLLFFARAWRTGGRGDLIWWAALSILALLTQYYASFLVAPEGLALVYRYRSRITVLALGALGVVELALIPHVVPRLDRPVQFIVSLPLSLRLQQVPVTFAMNTLYKSSLVSYGLIGAAVVGVAAIGLLIAGAGRQELRGAGLAAALAGAVILVPLALALAGHDAYIARGLMPGWVPLAIVLAAACTARGARTAGAVLAVALLALFVYAGIRIQSDPSFQKTPDWRAVAAALGPRPPTQRAIVVYDGVFGSAQLSLYLDGVPWSGPGLKPTPAPVTVSEVDVVGNVAQRLGPLPGGIRVISSRTVGGSRIVRFGLARPWTLTPEAIGTRAPTLLGPSAGGAVVMVQRPAA
ncbi:MAG: glycosyltransferase family 39 protein [Solirubrobacteraceae bacterium]